MKKTTGIISAIIASATFGIIPFFALPVLKMGMNAPSVLFYRNLFCSIILAILCIIRGKSLRVPRAFLKDVIILCILYIASSVPLVYSFSFIPTGLATTIHFMYPIGVTVLMALIFKEKCSIKIFLVAAISLVGVAILCVHGNTVADIRGILLALITVITYASYIVMLGKLLPKYQIDSDVFVSITMFLNAILLFIISITITGFTHIPAHIVSPSFIPSHHGIFNLICLSIIATTVPNVLFVNAVKYAGPTIASIVGSMEPLMATIIGILCFAEPFAWNSIIGFIIIIGSVIYVVIINRDKKSLNH